MSTIKTFNTHNTRGPKKFQVEFFDSADEVVRTCKSRTRTSGNFYDMPNYAIHEDWHGVNSYAEALDLMATGYQPTVDSMKGVFNASLAGEHKRFGFKNSIQGFAPIVPLALKGVPNSMLDMTMKPIKAKVIDIYYNLTVHCGISTKQILKAGQELLGTIVELEQQGYRFNLYAVQFYTDSESSDVMVVKMKSATQPLDIKRTSFPLTHPAFLRVIGFDWYSKVPNGKYRGGYGQPLANHIRDNEMPALAKELFGNNAILFNASEIVGKSKDSIKETITNAECKDR